jgi:hypothetical protein
MGEDRSSGHGRPSERHGCLRAGDGIRFLLRGEEQILQSISEGVPLLELLNRICNALDCEIGNVVSLVSLLDEDATDFVAIAGKARHLGLHEFCSIGIVTENHELLGALEMYSCKQGQPSPRELDLIERAGCLAAIAIEGENDALEDANAVVAETWPLRRLLPDWSKTSN